jgi:protein-tyrosine phosphatase
MTQINPYPLWIGHAGEALDYPRLAEQGIEVLVSLAAEEACAQVPRELVYLRIPLVDGIGNRAALIDLAVTTVAKLLSLETPTAVCCGAGKSRAPTIAAAALAVACRGDFADSLRQLSAQHPCDVAPGFWDEVKLVLDRKGR